MKKIRYLIFICLIIFTVLAFSLKGTAYKKYQTLDEYKLQGVLNINSEVREPYVMIKETQDTIYVLISNQKTDIPYVYVNKGSFWFNLVKKETNYNPEFKTDTNSIYLFEKFIFNDTIIGYDYEFDKQTKDIYYQRIIQETRDTRMILYFNEYVSMSDDLDAKLKELKYYVKEYKNEGFIYYSEDSSQRRGFEFFNKKIIDDTLFIYENNMMNNYQLGCLCNVKLLNSLGEFDPHEGKSIFEMMPNQNKCK